MRGAKASAEAGGDSSVVAFSQFVITWLAGAKAGEPEGSDRD